MAQNRVFICINPLPATPYSPLSNKWESHHAPRDKKAWLPERQTLRAGRPCPYKFVVKTICLYPLRRTPQHLFHLRQQ